MGLQGSAAIVGIAEYPQERKFSGTPRFSIEQWADLTKLALDDAGLTLADVDGIVCADVRETAMFNAATVVEYLGRPVNFAEHIDLGGASPVGAVWRAAAAIELGICGVVVCAMPARPVPREPGARRSENRFAFGASSNAYGSPQAEFDIPYGNLAQNCGYAMIAQRYGAEFGYDPRAMAKIAAQQRFNALTNPNAVFRGQPITEDDVLASKMIADPLHILEIVMPCTGGAAVVIAGPEAAGRTRHRPARITGFGEHLTIKTPTYAEDMVKTPVGPASRRAFEMAGVTPADIDVAEMYDCYTITVLLTIEDAGFCGKGEGMDFVREHDLTYRGDFPLNTHGGQLGAGQAGLAGGMTQVVEAVRQIQGRAEDRQVPGVDRAFVSGTGGVMSEQAALILEGA